jgi:hypothetical protein
MKLSLEKINKYILFIALTLLIYRKGSFSQSIPNPFEMLVALLTLLTFLDLVINKKFKEFFLSIPKVVWTVLSIMVLSILIGWFLAYIHYLPSSFNMVLEFGSFGLSVATFILILFYTRNDERFTNLYTYAFLVPVIFMIFLFLDTFAYQIGLGRDGTFSGLTPNLNIFSKTVLIPSIFFYTNVLFETDKRKKMLFAILAAGSSALVFWAAERGAILSMSIGILFAWILYILKDFQWKKTIQTGLTIVGIIILSFLIVPSHGKKVVLNRVLNTDEGHIGYVGLKDISVKEVVINSINDTQPEVVTEKKYPADSRLVIWPHYLSIVKEHPQGIGPNTHVDAIIPYRNVTFYSPGPHNSYLQILLWGGVVALLSFLYLLWYIYKHLFNRIKEGITPRVVALFGIVIAFSVSIIFNDSIHFYWFWAMLALALRV